jgi:hypothetical protein
MPELDEEKRKMLHLVRTMPHTMTEKEIRKLAQLQMNGRQIKNILKAAQMLATRKGEGLGFKHVEMVSQAQGCHEAWEWLDWEETLLWKAPWEDMLLPTDPPKRESDVGEAPVTLQTLLIRMNQPERPRERLKPEEIAAFSFELLQEHEREALEEAQAYSGRSGILGSMSSG